MSKKYTESETLEMLRSYSLEINKLHDAKAVNWMGTVKGQKRPYQDVVAKEFLGSFDLLGKISVLPKITRTKSYRLDSHGFRNISDTNREEENLAKRLCERGDAGELGQFIDYQVPLRSVADDPFGKIDLISIRDPRMYFIELKYSSIEKPQTESLLRASIELSLYWQVIDKSKLISDFRPETKDVAEPINKALLLPATSYSHQVEMLADSSCLYLRALLRALDIQIFLFDLDSDGFAQNIVRKRY